MRISFKFKARLYNARVLKESLNSQKVPFDALMPHVWYFHALNESVDLKGNLGRLKEFLPGELTLDERDANNARRTTLIQDRGESVSRLVLFNEKKLEIPTVLAFTGDRDLLAAVLEWLKSVIGVVMYRITLDQSMMLAIADAMCGGDRFYDSKFIFDVTTEDKNLTSMGIEVDKKSLRSLSAGQSRPYQESVVPYVYEETGLLLKKLPMASIALLGHARIAKDTVTTLEDDIEDKTLSTILESIQ